MKSEHVDAIIANVVVTTKSQAHTMRKRLVMLFNFAVARQYRRDNPARLAQKVKYKAKGWQPWTEADIEKYRAYWKPETSQRLSIEVLLNTGLRRSDAVTLGPQHRDGNRHVVKLKKSGETVTVYIPIHRDLEDHLKGSHNHLVYLATVQGAARSDKAFTNYIIEAARDAGLPPHRSPHGLRKAMCRRLTDAGCTPQEISAITGQSIVVIERYIRDYNRESAAVKAMKSIGG